MAWVLHALPEYTAVPVIPGFWNWFRSYNTGAAFSFLSDAGGWQQGVFAVLAVVVSTALGRSLARMGRGEWRRAAPYALIIGGAPSNALDRVLRGHVVDFIQWHWKGFYWPSFNLSDSAIMVGAVGLVVLELAASRARSGSSGPGGAR